MPESCIDDEIPQCKCANGPIKVDIVVHKKNYNQITSEDSNNLLTFSTPADQVNTADNNSLQQNNDK